MIRTVEEALALREAEIGQICMGEVHGRSPDGFDFGHSPFEISGFDFGDNEADRRWVALRVKHHSTASGKSVVGDADRVTQANEPRLPSSPA